jgi:hypothetical protein
MKISITRAALLLALSLSLAVASCKKKGKGENAGAPSPVEIRFAHKVTAFSNLVLDSSYPVAVPTPQLVALFTIKDFKYYISNIQFVNATTGDTVKIPDTYFLVEHKKPQSLKLQFTVPAGEYYAMSFLIGIDDAKNSTGPHTGALDPGLGMFWNKNDGYIMGLLEGTSTASIATDKSYSFHIGGTKAPYDVTARRHFKLGGNISIDPTKKTVINIDTDAKAWLTTPNGPLFVTTPVINAPGDAAFKVSQNYFKMFEFVSVKFE